MKVSFQTAVQLLRRGRAVALPTETVYGLGASLSSLAGLRQIFRLKRRPRSDPLIIHCLSAKQALSLVCRGGGQHFGGRRLTFKSAAEARSPAASPSISEAAAIISSSDIRFIRQLWAEFSPGPFTLILPKGESVPDIAAGGLSTAALRIPSHPLMRRIISHVGQPIAAPSANMFGQASPTRAEHVAAGLGAAVPILDGGPCEGGLESTIVQPDFKARRLIVLRPGAVTKAGLRRFLKRKKTSWPVVEKSEIKGAHSLLAAPYPGGFKRHYAPKRPLYIVESGRPWREVRAYLARKLSCPPPRIHRLPLSGSSQKAARDLYQHLHALSLREGAVICALLPLKERGGLWRAIRDRLHRASSGIFRLD